MRLSTGTVLGARAIIHNSDDHFGGIELSSYVSPAELEKRRKEALERQRQERLRKIREATEQYSTCMEKYEVFSANVSLAMRKELLSLSTVDELRFACDSFSQAKSKINKDVDRLTSQALPIEPEDIQKLTKRLSLTLSSLEREFNMGLSDFSDRLSLYQRGKSELSKSREFSNTISKIEKEKKRQYSNINFGIACLDDVTDSNSQKIEQIDIADVVHECALLINNSAIGKTERSQLVKFLNVLQGAEDSPMTLQALVSQYKILRSNTKRKIRIFNAQYSEYSVIYAEYCRQVEKRGSSALTLLAKQAFESVADLEKETKRIDQIMRDENERAYIRHQIDEVMASHGYSSSESIIMRNATKGQHYIFESMEEDTPVHCFIADNHAIMLEPVGIDSLDDGNAEYNAIIDEKISDELKERIVERQKSFCTINLKIVDELRKRGVIMTNGQRREAGMKYAKQLRIRGKVASVRKVEKWTADDYQNEKPKLRSMKL